VYRLDIYLVSDTRYLDTFVSHYYSPGGSHYLRVSCPIASTPSSLHPIHSLLVIYASGTWVLRAALLMQQNTVSVWGYAITKDCMERISSEAFTRTHVSMSKILELERALRSYPKPVLLELDAPIPPEFSADSVYVARRRVLWALREESSECSQLSCQY
jgi:hypothetical protein